MLLEPPSALQREFVKTSEERRLHMTELELKMLQKRGRSKVASEEGDTEIPDTHETSGDEVMLKALTKINAPRRTDGPQFKRKKPKVGPIPIHSFL